MKNQEYYQKYQKTLENIILSNSRDYDHSQPMNIEVDELIEFWDKIAPEFMIDAVKNINKYPKFTLAIPAFFAKALAKMWDENYQGFLDYTYQYLCGPKGFDFADEYLLQKYFSIKPQSKEYQKIADEYSSIAQTAMDIIRKEQIEPMTTEAFYILAESAKAIFKAVVAIELSKKGYKYHKQEI